jgi:hypothetical protein
MGDSGCIRPSAGGSSVTPKAADGVNRPRGEDGGASAPMSPSVRRNPTISTLFLLGYGGGDLGFGNALIRTGLDRELSEMAATLEKSDRLLHAMERLPMEKLLAETAPRLPRWASRSDPRPTVLEQRATGRKGRTAAENLAAKKARKHARKARRR